MNKTVKLIALLLCATLVLAQSTTYIKIGSSQALTGAQGTTGANVFACTGSFTNGNLVKSDANGNCVDAGSSALPTTYNISGTQQTSTHLVRGRCTLGTDCSVTLSGSAVYTSSSTYDCVAIDRTGTNAVQFAPSLGSAFALTGTGTDLLSFVCVGN